MQIPFDLSNLILWFAFTSITLLITTLFASAYDGNATLLIDERALRNTALAIGLLFLVTMVIGIYELSRTLR